LRLINGFFILASVLLSRFHNPNWLYFTGLIGVMLVIAGLTGFCLMEKFLKALGVKEMPVSEKKNACC